jgi:putative heme-binding domain-containing protein
VFAKNCQQCHVLFDVGRKVGPELTGSNRANLDYVLSNVLDPSALIGKDYQVQVIVTTNGRTLNGVVKAEDPDKIVLGTANEDVTISKADIDERVISDKSMMPEDLVRTLSEREFKALVAYLASPQQAPLPVTTEAAATFFNGKDLAGWTGNKQLWSVENGEIVGKSTVPVKRNEFLYSDLLVDDFRLELEVKLLDNTKNSGVQFRSKPRADGEMEGYQADVGQGWWGKLYEESLRGLLWNMPGDQHVKVGEWNKYEIVAVGSRVRTWLNGQPCVDLEDPKGLRSGVIALQVHSGGPTEVRFKNLKLTPLPSKLAPPAAGQYLSSKVARPASEVTFEKATLDRKFRTEGGAYGDFNNDGLLDVAAGSVWYEAPDWKMHSILAEPKEFDIKTYGDTFFNWAEDLDGDGRQDLIVVDFPGKPTWWFKNPGLSGGEWTRYQIVPVTNNESPQYLDVDGDGRRELIFGQADGRMCFARPAADPYAEWIVTPFAGTNSPKIERFTHGLGLGDINKDGRNDVIVPMGWWEAPNTVSQQPWQFHKAPFGEAQAHMYVFDFDGDGDNDIVGSSAHRRGIWWYEQKPDGWETHLIDQSIAQTHSLMLADINGDGLPDLVTGKRFYAHNGRDPGEDEPPHLSWFELTRDNGKPKWTQHIIDEDSGVGVQHEVYDMNADGKLDVLVANKHGVFVLMQK